MEYTHMEYLNGDLYLHDMQNFNLGNTLDSGQCFRWQELSDGSWTGIAYGKNIRLGYLDRALVLYKTAPEDFFAVWNDYFDLDRDYGALSECMSEDPVLARALAFAPGIRILRQPPFETLCSFILSQNNNIKRIKGLVRRLCEQFGKPIEDGNFAFPEPEDLAGLTVEKLTPVRAGFRARYLLDAANKVSSGDISLSSLYTLPLEEARLALRSIVGVGPKVADCVLLYGFGRTECFPVDVWISRALRHLYPEGFPERFSAWGGIAQQTLFHYVRCCADALPSR